MSSPDSTKKRRVATGNNGGGGVDNNGDDGTTMSTILAKLNYMQNEMNGMKSRLSRMDKLEEKYIRQEDECSLLKANCNALEKRVKILDTRCESLQRSVQILSKESTWEYSASPISLSHWRGFPEDYVDRMQEFLDSIKRYTCQLRRGGNIEQKRVYLGSAFSTHLQHDDILLPHWKELANTLQLHELNDYILLMHNIQLTSEVLDLLAPALKGKAFTRFSLFNNDFEDTHKGIEFITECVKSNNKLLKIHCHSKQFDNMKDVHQLVDAIINNLSINRVDIENCLGGDMNSYEAIRPLFNNSDRTWESIALENNYICTNGDTAIPDYIASNPPLNHLYLARNKLNDNDAILIASALKCNTILGSIRIQNNTGITDTGHNALTKAVYDPTSLNSMSDCNHMCIILQVDGDGERMNIPSGCRNNHRRLTSSIARRKAKIYQLLSERNEEGSNVQHLNAEFEDEEEDSLKLVPKVLECIHSYPKPSQFTVHPLSIMYEVIRGWKMPELYEKRS